MSRTGSLYKCNVSVSTLKDLPAIIIVFGAAGAGIGAVPVEVVDGAVVAGAFGDDALSVIGAGVPAVPAPTVGADDAAAGLAASGALPKLFISFSRSGLICSFSSAK